MKKTGYFITGLGTLITLLCLAIDLFGIGKAGIQSAQLLGIQIGVVIALFGLGLVNINSQKEKSLVDGVSKFFGKFLNAPILTWLLLGFFVTYLLFFIFPVFFNSTSRMFYFFRYIPDQYPIGGDLLYNTSAIHEWLLGHNPYSITGHFYPPLYHVVFAPILLLGYPNNYYLLTSITIASLVFMTFVLPFLLGKSRDEAVLLFFLLTGLFSYGLQFELERGQFNVIALMLCVSAIYLFYYHPEFRYLAYFIFSVSIHLKLYPAIFIVMFVKDWKDWKSNIKRFAGLGIFNIALLFVMGPDVLLNFLQALQKNSGAGWTFPGNHSIMAFVYNLTHQGYDQISSATLPWLNGSATLIGFALMGCFLVCFLLVFSKAYRENSGGLNPDLLLVCTLGAMMLPSVSIDYKLELLAAPMAIAFSNREIPEKMWQKIVFIFAILIASIGYSLTLVPYKYRIDYGILVNSLPMLFAILLAITTISLISKREAVANPSLSETA
jgi:hypothetical protein